MGEINMKMLNDRVLVKPIEREQFTKGGIIIPDTAKEKPIEGIVISVGPGTKDYEMTVKVDDKVLFSKYGGTDLVIDNEKYLIMNEKDIFAII